MASDTRDLILDNGAFNVKIGYSTEQRPLVAPNAVFKGRSDRHRNFVSSELKECQDKSKLFYSSPFERGYLVNWDCEFEVWDHLFGPEEKNVDFRNTRLLLTDPSALVPAIQRRTEEIVFESYQFASLNLTSAPSLVALYEYHLNGKESTMVVDSGYSFTHVVPFHSSRPIGCGIRRIDIGGKAMTNQLKEWISYKQLDVRDETYIINRCKEALSFVSLDFKRDMKAAIQPRSSNPFLREYVLPDFMNLLEGFVCAGGDAPADATKIAMAAERFLVPELLFHPNDVGVNQAGVVESIENSIRAVEKQFPDLSPPLHENIVCVGGNAEIAGFFARIRQDLRPLIDESLDFHVPAVENPSTHAWTCAQRLLTQKKHVLARDFITKREYQECGPDALLERHQRQFYES